ncbi:MAG: hypothetical protein AB7F35_30435 [Acetobacteraceae bacterium]
MDDAAENFRLSNMVRVPAILVRDGTNPSTGIAGMIDDPVIIPVQIEPRQRHRGRAKPQARARAGTANPE